MKFKKVYLIVMDSVGVGESPKSCEYDDFGVNTISNLAKATGGISLPNLEKLGFGNITSINGVNETKSPLAYVTKLDEASLGKDTMTGHWEMMGIKVTKPFKTFTDTGFPKELIDELEKATNRKIIGNKSASGTEILDEYGEHQMKTGDLILYTSADSVLQIAAHEEIIPLNELYDICQKARDLTMKDEWKVGRVIARPYIGTGVNKFNRTSNRHDYALKPFGKTVLDSLKENNFDVISIGKINDIFDGEGITEAIKTVSNDDGMDKLISLTNRDFTGLAFLNLVDFDALYGHRRNSEGYKVCLEEFDFKLGEFLDKISDDDLVMITADHGNDPTYKGTDHTREYVPLIMYNKKLTNNGTLDIGETFANIGATIAENFSVDVPSGLGESYLNILK
ncbi:MAG: phosphopentomutase [Lachnospirales bacterium]